MSLLALLLAYQALDAVGGHVLEVLEVPASPCPDTFQYQIFDSFHHGQGLKGVITVRSSQLPLRLKVKLLLPIILTAKYEGRLEVAEDMNVLNERLRKGRLGTIRYNLFFTLNQPIPQVTLIQANDKVICSSFPRPQRMMTTVVYDHTLLLTGNQPHVHYNHYNANDPKKPIIEVVYDPGPGHETSTTTDGGHHEHHGPTEGPRGGNRMNCGIPLNKNPLILDGTPISRGDWPWVVPLFEKTQRGVQFICGSTLVSDRLIVTAAHCVQRENGRKLKERDLVAFVGRFNISSWDEDKVQSREIAEIVVHPDYDPTSLYSDLAVLKLSRPVVASPYVNPACLWSGDEDQSDVVGKKGMVFGWGTDGDRHKTTDVPRLAVMPIVSQEECMRSRPEFVIFTSNKTLCAGNRDGSGPCNGDSGGGLMLPVLGKDGITRWFLCGVVSLSVPQYESDSVRCNLNEYIVFADVRKHRIWLSTFLE